MYYISSIKVHQIKLAAMFFDDVASGRKSFEIRKNDRGYKVGDILEMMEFKSGKETERMVRVKVTYMIEEYTGIEEGYCVMGIERCRKDYCSYYDGFSDGVDEEMEIAKGGIVYEKHNPGGNYPIIAG